MVAVSAFRWEDYRGHCREQVPLAQYTWFRVGGPADYLFKPRSTEELQHFLAHKPQTLPAFVLGMGSNLIIRDGGIPGVVIRLSKLNQITVHDNLTLTVGSGCLDRTVALTAAGHGLGGLEFLAGIPGTIGGAIRMNAGAYGTEIKDILVNTKVIDNHGNMHLMTGEDLELRYRHSALPRDWTVVEATFRALSSAPPAQLHDRIEQLLQEREMAQPVNSRTGGSTFKNPPGEHKAWQLIDQAGCRGLRLGGAHVSTKHCNFLINDAGATANDLETLGETVRQRVHDHTASLTGHGIWLEWEILRVGLAATS